MQNKNLIQYQSVNDNAFVKSIKQAYESFDLSAKTILLIEPYGAATALLKRGLERGFNMIILTADADFRIVASAILQEAKLAIKVDTANESVVLELAKAINRVIPIDAVMPGFEYFVPVAAKAAHELKVLGVDLAHLMSLRRKDLMRDAVFKAKLNCPKYFVLNSLDQLDDAIAKIGFPAVCKPVDAAGSVNVRKVNSKEEAYAAAKRILKGNDVLWGHALSQCALLEEYVEGKEYSLEGVIQNNKVLHMSMTEKFVSDETEFVEIGHIANTTVKPEMRFVAENYVSKVIAAVGANHCPFHAEIRITPQGEPVLMEIAARLAGDKIGDLINLARSINYFDYIYAVYLGEPLPKAAFTNYHAGIRFFYRPSVDKFTEINGIDAVKKLSAAEMRFYYQPNEIIPAFPKPLRRLGHVMLKNDNYNQLLQDLEFADKQLKFG